MPKKAADEMRQKLVVATEAETREKAEEGLIQVHAHTHLLGRFGATLVLLRRPMAIAMGMAIYGNGKCNIWQWQ